MDSVGRLRRLGGPFLWLCGFGQDFVYPTIRKPGLLRNIGSHPFGRLVNVYPPVWSNREAPLHKLGNALALHANAGREMTLAKDSAHENLHRLTKQL
jgi:hypothetical protein